MAPAKATSSPWRPRRQSRVNTLNSISAMLSQLACLAETVGLDPVVQHAVQTLRGVSPLDRTGWPSPSPTRPEVALPQPSTPPVAPGQARGGNHRSARKSMPRDLPRRRRRPTVLWCAGPGPAPPPWSPRSTPPCRGTGQALGQQQHGVPARPLPGRGRQNHPARQVLDAHLPLFQNPVYLPDSHHSPIPTRLSATCLDRHFALTLCAFHLGVGLGGAIAGVQNSLSPLAGQQA